MRRIGIALAVIAGLSLVGFQAVIAGSDQPGQADTTKATKIYDPFCPRCSHSARARYGGGGGPVAGYVFANLDVINAQVKTMGISAVPENILMMGGKGYARFGHVIIGGGGYGGSSEASGMPDQSARFATVDFGYGGAIFGATTAYSRYDLTAGVLLGGGSITVTRKLAAHGVFSWGDAWDTFRDSLPDSVATHDLTVSSRITADFLAIEPFVELKIWFSSLIALDLSGSYLRAHVDKGTWKMDGLEILDSPGANLGGPSVKLGLMFGG